MEKVDVYGDLTIFVKEKNMGISYMMPSGPAHIPARGGGKSGINKSNFTNGKRDR